MIPKADLAKIRCSLSRWLDSYVQLVFFSSCRNVLELGSGLGLLGMFICKMCNPQGYIFTDYHEKVLQLLDENITLNGINPSTKSCQLKDDTTHEICHKNDSFKGYTNIEFQIDIGKNGDIPFEDNGTDLERHSEGCDHCRSIRASKPDISCVKLDWQNPLFPDVINERKIDVIVGTG